MPAITEKATKQVRLEDLADMLNRDSTSVSRAAHDKYFCAGYPVFKWAVWHPRGNQVRHYEVPVHDLKELLPPAEYSKYGIFETDADSV